MFHELPDDGRIADYSIEVTEAEADAIMAAIRDADARKSEVKLARKAVGIDHE